MRQDQESGFSSIKFLLTRLSAIDWDRGLPPPVAHELLSDFYTRLELFKQDLGYISRARFHLMAERSRETATHYKWYLGSGPGKTFVVWLHEHKNSRRRGPGFAQSVHNHRYPLSTLILAGGYMHTKYSLALTKAGQADKLLDFGSERLVAGDTYTLSADRLHSVTEVDDHTVTLVIQHRPVQPFSISVEKQSLEVTTHVPIEGRYDYLRTSLIHRIGRTIRS